MHNLDGKHSTRAGFEAGFPATTGPDESLGAASMLCIFMTKAVHIITALYGCNICIYVMRKNLCIGIVPTACHFRNIVMQQDFSGIFRTNLLI